MEIIRLFISLARPIFLLGVALTYALGAGIAHYLGNQIDWGVYFIGQAWITTMQLSAFFLGDYYNSPRINGILQKPIDHSGSGSSEVKWPSQRVALLAAFACLAMVASSSVLLISQELLDPEISMIMVFIFLCAFFYSAPPVSFETSGYGELIVAIVSVLLVPAFAFLLQAHDLHRLLAMSTFPLVGLFLAMIIALEFINYGVDIKHGKRTLLVRIGWQSGITIHNLLILSAFILVGLAAVFGLPHFVIIAAFVTLPIGLFGIWQLLRIGNGSKPNWTALKISAIALFGSMAYLITYSYWTH